MTNVSKNPLTKDQEERLFAQLGVLFGKKTTGQAQQIFSELLGTEEKIMLAKRLAIIIMLSRQQTIYFISNTLHVSSSTVGRIQECMEQGQFNNILLTFKKPTPAIKTIIESIDDILHLGGVLPHYGQTHKSEAYRKNQEERRK
jgi:uncharacterized protein YerC